MIFISVSYIYSTMYMYLYFDNFLLSEWFLVWCFVCESWNIRMLTCFYSSIHQKQLIYATKIIYKLWQFGSFTLFIVGAIYQNLLVLFITFVVIHWRCLCFSTRNLSLTYDYRSVLFDNDFYFKLFCRQVKTHNLKTLL